MKKQTLVAAALAATLLAPVGIAEAADKLLLKTPIAFSTALPGLGSPIPRVADALKEMSGGTLRMKIYEPGKLVPSFEILGAVSSGKINSGYTPAVYWAGKIPASPLFSAVPFGPEAGEYMAWLYYGNGLALYQEMYDQAGFNVHVIPCDHRARDLRLVRRRDQFRPEPGRPQDALLRSRWKGHAEAGCGHLAAARRRNLPGLGERRHRCDRVLHAGDRSTLGFPQAGQV